MNGAQIYVGAWNIVERVIHKRPTKSSQFGEFSRAA